LALAKFGAAVGHVLAAEDASARIRSASGQAQSTGRTARPSARSIRSDSRAASGRLLEAARSSRRDPDGTEAGGLERSLSVTGNFGAGSGSGALMKGGRFAADSTLEGDGFELSVPGRETVKPPWETGLLSGKTEADLLGNRRFESSSLQRRVCEPSVPHERLANSERGWAQRVDFRSADQATGSNIPHCCKARRGNPCFASQERFFMAMTKDDFYSSSNGDRWQLIRDTT
jgi:hypothetical protein